ncbi:hypothetical protein N657DRAFT_532653, partial [Parathielavia appendiculata]
KRQSSSSIRATLRKISRSHGTEEQVRSTAAITPKPRTSQTAELLNKTAKIAPGPFATIQTQAARMIPHPRGSERTAWSKAPQSPSINQDTPSTQRARYTNSLSRASGESYKKTAAAMPVLSQARVHAHDITNPKLGGARNYHQHHASKSMSWGQRAAAAALDIGRRFKARQASSSS